MGNSGWTADPDEIVVPPDATDDEPRVYIGPNDPIAQGLSQDAAMVFYWGNEKAFILSVEQSGPDDGQLHLWALTPGSQLHQIMDIDYNVGADQVVVSFGQGAADTQYDFYQPVDVQDILSVRGNDIGKGIVATGSDTLASAAIGAAETEVLLTSAAVQFEADRAYRVDVIGGQQGSVANSNPIWRCRKSNGLATGQLACFYRREQLPGTLDSALNLSQFFTTGSPAPAAAVLAATVSALAGTVTNTATFGGRHLVVTDVGPASRFPAANVIT